MIAVLNNLVRRTRQHHAIEHAALTLLGHRAPGHRFVGLSDPLGFTVFGNLEQAQVQKAVSDGMLRLQAGEGQLAIHPNCGTNLLTTGVLAALAASLSRTGRDAASRGPLTQIARAVIFILPALLVAQPLGEKLQRRTTLADISDRWMVGVRTTRLGPLTVSRIVIE